RGFDSNTRRTALLRRNFLRHWAAARRAGPPPRVFMKFGASHLTRGLNMTDNFDLGTLVPEIAAIEGGHAFQLLVLNGRDTQTSVFDPAAYTYRPGGRDQYQPGMEPLLDAAWPDAFTLFDTRPLRPIARTSATGLDHELMRFVQGFDAILILSGSTPSSN